MPRVSATDKHRLISAFEQDKDYMETARHLGINLKTATSIIRRHRLDLHKGRHGGARKRAISDEHGAMLVDYVEQHPQSTLAMMQDHLLAVADVAVSTTTIMRYLDGCILSLKLVHDVPDRRNEPATINARRGYVRWIIQLPPYHHCIFIDECGFNLWTRRSYGRSAIGQRCFRVRNGQRGQNVSLCMAISTRGVLHWTTVLGSFNQVAFQTFMTELSEVMADEENVHFIVDNCPIHNRVLLDKEGHQMRRLPPYSPFLNPIEGVFSSLKSDIKRRLSIVQTPVTMPARRELLIDLMRQAVENIEVRVLRTQYDHVGSFYERCIDGVVIHGD